MRIAIGMAASLALASCGENLPSEELTDQPGETEAAAEDFSTSGSQSNELEPDPILYPDIERHEMFGASCAYATGNSLGARVIARQSDAFMKLEGEVIRFVADVESEELPYGTRSSYKASDFALVLDVSGAGDQSGPEVMAYEGTISLRDQNDREVFSSSGTAQCGV